MEVIVYRLAHLLKKTKVSDSNPGQGFTIRMPHTRKRFFSLVICKESLFLDESACKLLPKDWSGLWQAAFIDCTMCSCLRQAAHMNHYRGKLRLAVHVEPDTGNYAGWDATVHVVVVGRCYCVHICRHTDDSWETRYSIFLTLKKCAFNIFTVYYPLFSSPLEFDFLRESR